MIDTVVTDVFKCVFFIMLVFSMAGGLVYFMEMLRGNSMINEIERLKERVWVLEHKEMCDGDDNDDDVDEEE